MLVCVHFALAGKQDWRQVQVPALPANLAFRRAATGAGTNGVTSPPIDAICRTRVAVIGRTEADAGTNTVCTSGAMVAFIPAISISYSKSAPLRRPRINRVAPARRAAATTRSAKGTEANSHP